MVGKILVPIGLQPASNLILKNLYQHFHLYYKVNYFIIDLGGILTSGTFSTFFKPL